LEDNVSTSPRARDSPLYECALHICCSVLQVVAKCCSVLQCVAVCCSVLHESTRA